jgi:hypothetical protein
MSRSDAAAEGGTQPEVKSEFRQLVVKTLPVLKKLLHSSCTQRDCILKKEMSPDLLHILSECSLNYLEGNIPTTRNQRYKLNKFRRQLQIIASKNVGVVQRRQTIQRGAGFLGPLLAIAIPTLISLLRSE